MIAENTLRPRPEKADVISGPIYELDTDEHTCGWSPGKDARWSFSRGQEWNTFDTEECARRASTSGLPRSVSRVHAGRRIPIGMRTIQNEVQHWRFSHDSI